MPIIAHHGKATAFLLIELCKHIGVDYFVINDWDFENDFVSELSSIETIQDLRGNQFYLFEDGKDRARQSKSMVTINWNLLNKAGNNIHFNIKKLETVLGYNSDNKSSVGFWKRLNEIESFSEKFFPPDLEKFLEFDVIKQRHSVIPDVEVEPELQEQAEYFPF